MKQDDDHMWRHQLSLLQNFSVINFGLSLHNIHQINPIKMFNLMSVSGSKTGKQTTLSFKPVPKKKNTMSDDDEDEESFSDMEVIAEEVAPRQKRERKGKDLVFFSLF